MNLVIPFLDEDAPNYQPGSACGFVRRASGFSLWGNKVQPHTELV
ncbi:MAG: hypothetical protein VKL59_07220 [Nostocaceae cyanobacterium]|nr:hypothetical protein [Nostocaceae cyanobacterium]